jgi:hypothetical protein
MGFGKAKFDVAKATMGCCSDGSCWRVVIDGSVTQPKFETKALAQVYVDAIRAGDQTPDFVPPVDMRFRLV